MPIELPPLPPLPNADSTPVQWDVYLRIVALHTSTATAEAITAQTAQMVKMTAAAERSAALMQQLLDQPTTPAPAPVAGSDAARVAVAALLGEIGDRTPADVATAALARMGAADRVLSGEVPAP
jgi:ATP phosphoribosyltransferase